MRHPKLRPDPGPPALAGQVALFDVPRQVRRLTPGPQLPSYGSFELEAPPRPEPQPLSLLTEEESGPDPKDARSWPTCYAARCTRAATQRRAFTRDERGNELSRKDQAAAYLCGHHADTLEPVAIRQLARKEKGTK